MKDLQTAFDHRSLGVVGWHDDEAATFCHFSAYFCQTFYGVFLFPFIIVWVAYTITLYLGVGWGVGGGGVKRAGHSVKCNIQFLYISSRRSISLVQTHQSKTIGKDKKLIYSRTSVGRTPCGTMEICSRQG